MSNKLIYVIMAALLAVFWYGVVALAWNFSAPKDRYIDCSMAEFHPDFTPQMREQCRLLRSGKLL